MENSVIQQLTESITPYLNKSKEVKSAMQTLDNQSRPGFKNGFGLLAEGGGRRNAMSICNATEKDIHLVKWYLEHGHNKVPPIPFLESKREDQCLWHNAGSWACTGSSGVVSYMVDYHTTLHIMWECPYDFNLNNNFIGLMLTSEQQLKNPDKHLFVGMFQEWNSLGRNPRAGSTFDLVCCGPGDGKSRDVGGPKPFGFRRPCKVQDSNYIVYATMGDGHATTSKIVIATKEPTDHL